MKSKINKNLIKKSAIYLLVITAVASLTVFFVTAYQSFLSEDTVNDIKAPKLNVLIEENIVDDTKEKIVFTAQDDNTENAYIRATVVAYWTALNDSDTIILDDTPNIDDYINFDDWEKVEIPISENNTNVNTYYQYKEPLPPGETTSNLLSKPLKLTVDSEKKLEVTVLLQAVDKETYERGVWQ